MYQRKKYYIILLLNFCFVSIFSLAQNQPQNEGLVFQHIKGNWEGVATDPLGFIYAYRKDEIFKFNQKGDTLYQQSTKQFGDIASIDVSQSMRILIFFENLQSIGFTDNTLSWHQNPTGFDASVIPYPKYICQSFFDNNLWVYDGATLSLLKLNKNLEVIQRTENMPAILNASFNPITMKERNDKLYVLDSLSGVYVFDLFGSLYRNYKIKGATQIDIKNNEIFYLKENKIYQFDALEEHHVPLQFEAIPNVQHFALLNKKVVILNKKGIYIVERKR